MSENTPKILFLDDEEEFVQLLSEYFGKDYDVTVETDPRDALERLNRETFDLIISDYLMPGMDGRQFIKKLREDGIHTPIFFLSGMFELKVVKDLVNLGAACLFNKPLDFEELQRNVRGLLHGELIEVEEEEVAVAEGLEQFEAGSDARSFLPLLSRPEMVHPETLSFLREVGLAMKWNQHSGDVLKDLRQEKLTEKDAALPTLRGFVESRRDQQLALYWQLYNGDVQSLAEKTGLPAEAWQKWSQSQGWAFRTGES